jgi:hypothetical protein
MAGIRVWAGAVAFAVASFGIPGTAVAAAPSDTDLLCGFNAVADPNPEAPADARTGYVEGGPILQNGTITCTIQVGGALHSDADNGATASASGTNGVTYLSPTLISFVSPSQVPVYLCDRFRDAGGTTYYFDDTTGTWTSTPTGAACRLTISVGTDDPVFDPVYDLGDALLNAVGGGRPYYVSGTITITARAFLGTTIAYTGFDPPLSQWSCAESTTAVTCRVTSTAPRYRYSCLSTSVVVENHDPGMVSGSSGCSGTPATAWAPPESSAGGASATPGDTPWTCDGDPSPVVWWRITCTVG